LEEKTVLKKSNMETLVKNTTWNADLAHSELTFKVKHLMISNVKGSFNKFDIQIQGDDLTRSKIFVTVDPSSINTNDEGRDAHLKSADFFDVENHKSITFEAKSLLLKEADKYELTGMLTMKGVAKEVRLDVEYGGTNTDSWGNEKAGFSFSGKINRKDWGLNWNGVLETGGVLVSEEVKIEGEIQFKKQS
jgi:polyisoprenoid-binding protein YceI